MVTDLQAMSLLERANAAMIHYPRLDELFSQIDMRRRLSKLAREPRCMSLGGYPGTGKTTLVRVYTSRFPWEEGVNGRRIPVFYMEMPSPVTVKDAASQGLHSLGDPAYEEGTAGPMSVRLIELIKGCNVELVILDDIHNLIDSQTDRVIAKVADWLKSLIKKTGKPFLIVGITGKVEMIVKASDELSRLFGPSETLAPFAWDPAKPKTTEDFARFMEYVETAMEKRLSVEVARTEMLYRIHYATGGVVGNMMNIMRCATLLAEDRGSDVIDLALLARAFQEELAQHTRRANPFIEQVGDRFIPPPPSAVEPKGSGRGKRGGKPSAAETLRAS